jgi:uncharacterized protein
MVVDVNLLLYATITGFPQHSAAREWWEATLSGDQAVGLSAPALFGFLRIATNPRVLTHPMPVEDAITQINSWLERPHVRFLNPGARHLELAFTMLRDAGTAGNLTTDAQLAALAVENQAELVSNDTDFGKFSGLRWTNPLAVA